MRLAKKGYIVGEEGNVVLVDFTPSTDPPAPRFPGACALRKMAVEGIQPRSNSQELKRVG